MGAAINGKKVAGFAINGKIVAGLAKNGVVIWRKPSDEYPELIVNGGFEDGLTGWTIWGSGQVITSDTGIPQTPYEGSRYFKATVDYGSVRQTVTVEPGASYHIQYAYGSAVAGRQAFCRLSNGDTVLQDYWYTSKTTGWQFVELDYTVPTGVTSLTVCVGETVWGRFDAISMRRNK